MTAYDVVVVGAGIAGCAVAVGCAERGATVALIDRGDPGAQASGAAAGMLAPCSEAPEPGAFLDAARASLAMWPAFAAAAASSGIDCELALDGLLRVATSEDEATLLRDRVGWQQALGVEVEWIDGDAVAAREPAWAGGAAGAAWYPGEGHVHSPRTVRALVATARARGVDVRAGVELTGVSGGDALRLADGAALRTAVVVVAAGAWSGTVSTALGLPALPVRPVRGQLLALRGLPRLPRHVIFGGRLGYAVAKRDGLLLVGATEDDAGYDVRVTAEATESLLGTARRLVAGAGGATLHAAWAGLRPAAPDRLPLLGELGRLPRGTRVLVASGHYRNGVLLAPLTASGMTAVALDGAAPAGWEAFDPRRFL